MQRMLMHLPLVAVDLVDVVEDSWQQKRAWLNRNLAVDPGAICRSRAWVERHLRDRHGLDGHGCYEAMSLEISRPASLLRRAPVRGAVRGLHRLAKKAQVRLLSGRRQEKRSVTEAWLHAHGLGWLGRERLVLLDYRAKRMRGQGATSKFAWCVENGATALVDNQVAQLDAAGASASGLLCVLFSADPEEAARRPAGVEVARSWGGVVRLLRRRTVVT